MRKYIVLLLMLMATVSWGQFSEPGVGSSDSIGVDTNGNGTVDYYLFPPVIKKGDNITLGVAGDILTITGSAGGATDSATVYGWTFVLKSELGPFIDTTSTHIPVADSALKAVADGAGNAITSTYETITKVALIGDDTTNFKTAYGWGDHGSAGYESVINVAKIGDDTTNYQTAYTHSQDNSQAHSDYLINNGDDITSGSLTIGDRVTADTGIFLYHAYRGAVHADSELVKAGEMVDFPSGGTNGQVLKLDTGPDPDTCYWGDDGGGSASGYVQIQEGNAGSDSAETIDFGAGFDVSIATGEADVTLDLTEKKVNLTNEVTGVLPDSNISDSLTLQRLIMGDTVTSIHKIQGTMADNYIPKVYVDGNDTTIQWEADAGGGSTDSATVYGWNFVLKSELGDFIDTTTGDTIQNAYHANAADSAGKAANDGAGSQIATTYAKLSGITMAGDISMADYEIYNADTVEIEDALILASDTISQIHKITGDMDYGLIPKVDTTGGVHVVWSADGGAVGGTSDTLIINDGTTEYSTISNRLKIKEGTGLDITREDSTSFDVLRFTVSLGASITASEIETDAVGDDEIDYANVTLADFDYQTAWRVFYSNTDGDVTELALGADGTYLKSNGASAAPTFAVPPGTGDMLTSAFDDSLNNVHTLAGLWTFGDSVIGDTGIFNHVYKGSISTTNEFSTDGDVRGIVADSLGEYSTTAEVQAMMGYHHFFVNMTSPNLQFDIDSLWCLDPRTDTAITISRIDVSCDANPATELDFDILWADDFIGLANTTLIAELNTTAGVAAITSFSDSTVAAGKCIFLRFNVAPDANITQVITKVRWH